MQDQREVRVEQELQRRGIFGARHWDGHFQTLYLMQSSVSLIPLLFMGNWASESSVPLSITQLGSDRAGLELICLVQKPSPDPLCLASDWSRSCYVPLSEIEDESSRKYFFF